MYVVDRVGRRSDTVTTAAMNIPEIKFTENEFSYSRDSHPFGAEGNIMSPYYFVSLENPAEVTEPRLTDRGIRGEIDTENVFRDFYEAMPVYKDGEYTLTVKDHFGDEHESHIPCHRKRLTATGLTYTPLMQRTAIPIS